MLNSKENLERYADMLQIELFMADITATQWLRMPIWEREEFVAGSGLPDINGTQWLSSIKKRKEYAYEPLPESLDVGGALYQELRQELRQVFLLIDSDISMPNATGAD